MEDSHEQQGTAPNQTLAESTGGEGPSGALPPMPIPGQVLAGRYTVLERLGQGSMGVVLAAYDARLDRRVALKLLRPQRVGDEATEARLVREAQAMARLNHPHVVTVHDTGTLEDGRFFIAMEYVRGQTLRQWCRAQPRSWHQVLEAYLAAGRGLEAVHAAGLVHRDFKPDNVLVGEDGRVRVMDFGVARAESLERAAQVSTPGSLPPEAWETALTQPGAVVGTPRYMAPEVLLGQPADARSDVFALCVALWESLYHQPPFSGSTLEARTQVMAEGHVAPPPGSPVPGWLARVLGQGLAVDPGERPPSMGALLELLETEPRARRRTRLVTAGALWVALVGLGVAGWVAQREPSCSRMEERLAGVWDERVRQQVRQALVDTGLPYAQDTASRVEQALQAYAGTWVRLSVDTCEAVRAQAGHPHGLAVLQEYCLERRRSQLQALTALLARGPDPELMPRAVQAVQALLPLGYCQEAQALTAAVPPPESPPVRAQVEALEREVDGLEALHAAGKYGEGRALADTLWPRVELVPWPPLRARTLYLAALLAEGTGDYKGAEAQARQAIALAAEGRDDALQARAWSLLVVVVGARQARHDEALGLRLALTSSAARAGDAVVRAGALNALGTLLLHSNRLEEAREAYEKALLLRRQTQGSEHPELAAALNNLGLALQRLGRYPEAREHFEQAVALRQRVLSPEHPLVANALANLGNVLKEMGRSEQARGHLEQALALQQRALGPGHPQVAHSLNNLGLVLLDLERHKEAHARFEEALGVWRKALGHEHPLVATALNNLSIALQRQGRYAQALARLEQALALHQQSLGADNPDLAYPLHNLGAVLLELGQYAQARARLQQALGLWERHKGPEHPDVADSLAVLGRTLVRQRQPQPARRHLERALALMEKAHGPRHPALATPLLGLGELHLALGQPAQAVSPLERALTLANAETGAEVRLALALALWDAGLQRTRAHALASEALGAYQRAGHAPHLARASQWLAAHPLP